MRFVRINTFKGFFVGINAQGQFGLCEKCQIEAGPYSHEDYKDNDQYRLPETVEEKTVISGAIEDLRFYYRKFYTAAMQDFQAEAAALDAANEAEAQRQAELEESRRKESDQSLWSEDEIAEYEEEAEACERYNRSVAAYNQAIANGLTDREAEKLADKVYGRVRATKEEQEMSVTPEYAEQLELEELESAAAAEKAQEAEATEEEAEGIVYYNTHDLSVTFKGQKAPFEVSYEETKGDIREVVYFFPEQCTNITLTFTNDDYGTLLSARNEKEMRFEVVD